MGGYSSDKTLGHTFNLSECSYSECVSKNVMPNFHSSFMFVFIRRHLPAVALLQSLLAAGGDALNSAVASLLVRVRSVPYSVCLSVCVCKLGVRDLSKAWATSCGAFRSIQ